MGIAPVPWRQVQLPGGSRLLFQFSGSQVSAGRVLGNAQPDGFYRSKGMPAADSMLSVLREVAALFLGGAAVGVLGFFNQAAAPEVRWAVGLGAGFSFVFILLTSTAVFWRLMSFLPIGIQLPFAELMDNAGKRSLRWLPLTLGLSMVFWLMLGAAFRSLILAFEPDVVITWIEAASVFALAWCGGFVVVFIPAGLGSGKRC